MSGLLPVNTTVLTALLPARKVLSYCSVEDSFEAGQGLTSPWTPSGEALPHGSLLLGILESQLCVPPAWVSSASPDPRHLICEMGLFLLAAVPISLALSLPGAVPVHL
jgi:hypothetical protein